MAVPYITNITYFDGDNMTVTIRDYLTDDEIRQGIEMFKTSSSNFARKFADEVISPVIQRINTKLGQQKDPLFLAYAVQFVIEKVAIRGL